MKPKSNQSSPLPKKDKKIIDATFWMPVEDAPEKQLPIRTIMLCWCGEPETMWLSSPVAFETQEQANSYRDDNKVLKFLIVPDAR